MRSVRLQAYSERVRLKPDTTYESKGRQRPATRRFRLRRSPSASVTREACAVIRSRNAGSCHAPLSILASAGSSAAAQYAPGARPLTRNVPSADDVVSFRWREYAPHKLRSTENTITA